jgi:chemotaxis protein CheZ
MTDPLEREMPNRDADLMAELHDLTCNLRNALDRFRFDARLNDLAEKEMPDARQRLSHVLLLTSDAAHRTLDLVEKSGPAAERTAREAGELETLWRQFRSRQIAPDDFRSLVTRMDEFLRNARTDSDVVRANLAEVLLAQGYQDLSGQIIRGVMMLVAEVEKTLAELTRLARGEVASVLTTDPELNTRHTGPVVPGVDPQAAVVSDQEDVDALLSRLGM